MIKEEAPTNNVGSGAVAGTGIGPMGEPGVSVKDQRKRYGKNRTTPTPVIIDMMRRKVPNITEDFETFAGAMVFEVSASVFHTAKMEKRKHKTWRKYLEEDDCLAEVREYANKNPNKSIILKNKNTGEMTYARYGRRVK